MSTSAPSASPAAGASFGIGYRSITGGDMEFLCRLYASTRMEELSVTGWTPEQKEAFLRSQFGLQHAQYMKSYGNPTFDVVTVDGVPAGRLYLNRENGDIRIIDIALLPEWRGWGIGGEIMAGILAEADAGRLTVSLHVEPNNPALRFYRRLGFVPKGEPGVYLYMERPAGGAG